MTGWRFGLLAGALGLVVAAGSFAVTVAVLDDDEPDRPPTSGGTATTTPAPTTASTTTSSTVTGTLVTPAWIVVVASEGSQDAALEHAEAVAALGHPTGVLRSDDYASLNPGLWVAFAGPYSGRGEAEAAVGQLAADGVSGYVRCAGSAAECRVGDDDED